MPESLAEQEEPDSPALGVGVTGVFSCDCSNSNCLLFAAEGPPSGLGASEDLTDITLIHSDITVTQSSEDRWRGCKRAQDRRRQTTSAGARQGQAEDRGWGDRIGRISRISKSGESEWSIGCIGRLVGCIRQIDR